MVFKFTAQEVTELTNIMEAVEPDSMSALKDTFKDTNLMKVRLHPVEKSVEIIINENYSVEFLQVYAKFVGLFVSQSKALMATMQLFAEESQLVVDKYMVDKSESC